MPRPGRVLEAGDESRRRRASVRGSSATTGSCEGTRALRPPRLAEGPQEVHVAEDLVGLHRLVAPAEEHRLRPLADELDPVQVGNDGRHDERIDALAGKLAGSGTWRGLQLLVVDGESEAAQLLGEARPRTRRVVGYVAERVTGLAQPLDRVDSAGNRVSGNVQHAVDVEQNARHGA